ncbi:MAG: valine--tRNA ligase [Chitinophagales bacterium]|nr:valine--tRNA ligase [Chitinophagales bacterium]
MELAKTYDPKLVEGRWYQHWMEQGFFRSVPDEREPFTIVIPPPNVTGVLHMGHMLNNTIQDVLIRKARMEGKNACWVPGTDHASIATESKVVGMLREKGIKKSDISRDEFLKHAFEWKDKYGGIILEQLRRLGASCDWERTRFTMEDKLSKAVIKVFVDLYRKGYLYRDLKMINWDPKARTTLSNEEVVYKEKRSKLYHVRYQVEGSQDEWLTIATTRPETILGDTAVCVNPKDPRYTHLQGKKVLVPLIGRSIPVIFDEYVDMEFGTGALKVTPAHDINDYELGKKHNLETIDMMNDDGTISPAGQLYVGEDRFTARKRIIEEIETAGQLVKVEEIDNKVGYSERNPDTVVEPRLSLQWFVDMQPLAGPALENVLNDEIQFHPAQFKNLYKHWLENIRNWPISRQLWWGQQIPAWYLEDGSFFVAETAEEALELARKATKDDSLSLSALRQDEDVVDTWFSSWLWPISVFDGFENKEELNYYYPTNVLVTGWDIIFFWVARMIMAGYEYTGEKPFKHVYFTGMVRDKEGRKMSKSLGNSPDAMELLDTYGADGVRVGMLIAAPKGNDLLFDVKLCEQGRNFSNKVWNALRLIKGWESYEDKNTDNEAAIAWLESRLNQVIQDIDAHFAAFRLSDALMAVYSFIWDDFCSWYLEMIKPEYQQPIDSHTLARTIELFEKGLQLMHPFMPFITEEIWNQLRERDSKDCIIVSRWPQAGQVDAALLQQAEAAKEVISKVREVRNQKGLKQKEPLQLYAVVKDKNRYATFSAMIQKLAFLGEFSFVDAEVDGTQTFLVGTDQFFLKTGDTIDPEQEKARLLQERDYLLGFIRSVQGKLSNEKFVSSAPAAVVDSERKKLSDGEAKVKAIEESLAKLN